MTTTTSHTHRTRARVGAGIVALLLGLTACSGDEADTAAPTPTENTDPPLTAPPEPDPEEETRDELAAMLDDTVAALDSFYQNADEWYERAAGEADVSYEEASTEFFLDDMRVGADAYSTFSDSTLVWLNNEWMTDGGMEVSELEFSNIDLDAEIPTAQATACIDQSQMTIQSIDGEPAEDAPEPIGQTWDITWENTTVGDPRVDPSKEEADWYITNVDITPETPC